MRRGLRNSPAMWVPTSQPANAQTNRLIATPTPPQPFGRNGWKFDASTAGNVTATTLTTTAISSAGEHELHPARRRARRTSWR